MGVRPLTVALAMSFLAVGPWHTPAPGFADNRPGEAAREDQAQLQGVWTMAELVVNGYRADERQTRDWLLFVEGNQYNPGSGELSLEYTFRLDPTRTPRAIDLTSTEGPGPSRVFRGVYLIDGDTFTVCRTLDPEDDRPAGFAARPGSGLTRVVWKRQKH